MVRYFLAICTNNPLNTQEVVFFWCKMGYLPCLPFPCPFQLPLFPSLLSLPLSWSEEIIEAK
jgi:hypothetical protein